MAVDLAPHNIRVNALAPGVTVTNINRSRTEDPEWRTWALGRIPLGRLGQPEDLVGAVVFLASDESAYVTGTTLIVDGGYLARG
jgi:NAD(P)-dependent dehydrogenase (short-subunit alcohol dehydrogenase family)